MKIIAVIMAAVFAACMFLPVAAAETKTVRERIADIEETYGITVMDGRRPQRDWTDGARSDRADFEKNLTELEQALNYLGTVFTGRLARKLGGTFEVYIMFGSQCPVQYKNASGVAHETFIEGEHDSWIEFIGPAGTVLPAGYMLHEFAHCMEFLLTEEPPDDFTSLRKPFSGSAYTNKSVVANEPSSKPDKYASLRGEMDNREDYAECFRAAVAGGGDNPLQYGKDTDIYKKTYEVYIDLAAFAGYGSRSTKRVAAYLGVQIPQT